MGVYPSSMNIQVGGLVDPPGGHVRKLVSHLKLLACGDCFQ